MTQIARKMIAQFGAKAHWSFDGVQTLCGRGFRNAMVEVGETTHELCKSCRSSMDRVALVAWVHALDEDATWFKVDFDVMEDESVIATFDALRENEICPPVCAHGKTADQGCLEGPCGWNADSVHPIALRLDADRTDYLTRTAGVPAKLCTHGIDSTRLGLCSICREDSQPSNRTWHIERNHVGGKCLRYSTDCVVLSMIEKNHAEAVRLDEDRTIYLWVTDVPAGAVTDWGAVAEYSERRRHFTPEQWTKIARRAADDVVTELITR